jgi:hypothetical protein
MIDFFRVLSVASRIYLALLLLRMMSSWLRGASLGGVTDLVRGATDLLRRATDPYLQFFARARFLQTSGGLDLPALAGLAVMIMVVTVSGALAQGAEPTWALVGLIIAAVLLQMTRWVVLIFLFSTVGNFIMLRFVGRTDSPLARLIEALARPPVQLVQRYVRLGPTRNEDGYLMLAMGLCFAAWIVVQILGALLSRVALPSPDAQTLGALVARISLLI